ncbi:MAG: hypothetical protein AABX10_00135 [Nanoarchaeota archaeon]
MSLKEFKDNNLNGLLKTVFVSLFTSFIVFGIVYLLKLRFIDNFIPKYGFFIFFSILSYSVIIPAIKQVRVHNDFPCMGGMMIGMTIGMISGFLPGFFIASTNGMFYGSVFGMIVGMGLGVLSGKCCGIMGIMEGMMAGFMGGLMGAMTSIMMFNDNLKAIGIIVFVISSVILTGLNFMIYRETKGVDKKPTDEMFNIVLSFILTTVTIWLAVFGPRSGIFG